MESNNNHYIQTPTLKTIKQLGDEIHVAGISTVRPSLQVAMKLSEYKLMQNGHKSGWKDLSMTELCTMGQGEMVELRQALRTHKLKPSTKHAIEAALEAADVINYMMMIIDNILGNRYGDRGGSDR